MHVGIIGFGNIATALIGLLAPLPVSRATVLVRPGSEGAARHQVRSSVGPDVDIVSSFDDLLKAAPDLVVECAGHSAVASYGTALLEGGIDLVIVSIGALAEETLHGSLTAASSSRSSGRIILPIGAIGGLDLLSSLAQAGDLEVTYTGTKPPEAWAGTPAENAIDLNAICQATQFFSGNARDAARTFPKNANVVAALALAGPGFEKTRVNLVADPKATGNTHAYSVISPMCRFSMEITANPSPDNPRTSATTAWSVVSEIRRAAEARSRQKQ